MAASGAVDDSAAAPGAVKPPGSKMPGNNAASADFPTKADTAPKYKMVGGALLPTYDLGEPSDGDVPTGPAQNLMGSGNTGMPDQKPGGSFQSSALPPVTINFTGSGGSGDANKARVLRAIKDTPAHQFAPGSGPTMSVDHAIG